MWLRHDNQLSGTPLSNQLVFNAVGAAQKGGALQFLHSVQAYVVDANAVWSGQPIPRFNKSVVRWPANWTSKSISFNAQCTTKTNSDLAFSVVVDGALATTYIGTGNTVNRRVDIGNLPVAGGGSIVEVWEPFNARAVANNNNIDEPIEGGIVTGIWLPAGVSPTTPTATTSIVMVGDSIVSACLNGDTTQNTPECFRGFAGQIRLLAEANGWIVASLDYGSRTLCGDGYTAAQLAADIQTVATATGAATVKVFLQIGRNDWSYYGSTATNSPTVVGTALQAVQAALPSGYSIVIGTPIPQTDESANGGGFTLPNYRTAEAAVTGSNVTILAGTSYGISTANLPDGVHPNATAVAQMVAGIKGSLGL